VFSVTEPDGTTDTVTGSDSRDYPVDSTHQHVSMTFDSSSDSYDWTDPGNCSTPGHATPKVSSSKACKTGISVVLSNMNGTADTTFTVTAPDGSTEQVPVRAGQERKRSYAVTEDSTAVVTVQAPGIAKKTVRYHKNCAAVLGEKKTKKPPTPVVKGVKGSRLPFTGFDATRGLGYAAAMSLLGLVLLELGRVGRRRRTTH
jgi:hypothetical protein